MKKNVFIILGVIVAILIATGLITSYVDSARVRNSVEPKFTIKIVSKSGNKITYWGLGYKVIRYPSVSPDEPYKNNRGVKYGNWFMKYELQEQQQILNLTCNLNNKKHTYIIQYDLNNNITKVNNTDYYEFLQDGDLIHDVTILDTELTNYFVKNGGSCK